MKKTILLIIFWVISFGSYSFPISDTLTIAMTGDIMMGTTFPCNALPKDEGRHLFSDTKDILIRANLAVGNLEGVLYDSGQTRKQLSDNCFAFRTPSSYAPRLSESGYDFLSVANNHSYDFDILGVKSTEKALDAEGIKYAGIKGRIHSVIIESQGI